jgi:hypothetical protein
MTQFRTLGSKVAIFLGAVYSAAFLLVWLPCWPVYRLLRAHGQRA